MSDQEAKHASALGATALVATERLAFSETEEVKLTLPIGVGAILAAVASLGTCYAGNIGNVVLGVQWFVINPHVQAVLMWGLVVSPDQKSPLIPGSK